jgi:hypothetical protein
MKVLASHKEVLERETNEKQQEIVEEDVVFIFELM